MEGQRPVGAWVDEVPLFEGYDPPEPPVEVRREEISADRRRTIRQQQDVTNGVHPLTRGPLHPEATTFRHAPIPGVSAAECHGAEPCSGRRDPFTCGSCVHRVDMGWPKCDANGPKALTHSAATDVRAWWPACMSYEPKPGLEETPRL